jgi:chromosome segregation ATPase
MTMTNTTSSTDTSVKKHQLLLKLIDNGMRRSRKALDSSQLVQESYGDDASVFGGTQMLVGVMDSMLDKVHEQVQQEMSEYIQQEHVKERLEKIESIMHKLEGQEAAQAAAERQDRTSAYEALDATLLPPGVSLEDVLAHQKYEKNKQQRTALEEEWNAVQEEIATLEREEAETQASVQQNLEQMQQVAKELERSADICSMVGS